MDRISCRSSWQMASALSALVMLVAASCADIEVAVNGGGSDAGADVAADAGRDAVVPPMDGVGPDTDLVEPPTDAPDTGEPPTDVVEPPTDTGEPPTDTGEPPTDTGGPEDVVEPVDTPVGPDVAPPNCTDELLDPAWGDAVATAFTLEGDDDFAGSCGGADSKDFAYGWRVPFTEWFVLDTFGSDFDTALYVLETCDGPEIACNNDVSDTDDRSRIVRRFREGDRHVVVLDGNSGSRGNAVLNIQPVTCPAADVQDGASLPQTFSTATGPSEHVGACGGDAGPERTFRFMPPENGLWRISAKPDPASGLDPALYLERGPICGGRLLQCNGHDGGDMGMPAQVTRQLRGGEPVTIIVESRGGAGAFDLSVEKLADTCPAIPVDDIDPEVGLDFREYPDVMTTSCGQNADVEFGAFRPYGDVLVAVQDLQPGAGAFCQLEVEAGFPFAMALVAGECSGEEVACLTTSEMQGDSRYRQGTGLPKLGGMITVVVSPIVPEWGGWTDSIVRIFVYCVA